MKKEKMCGISFKMPEQAKKDMQRVCDSLGISMAQAFYMFALRMSYEQKLPFEPVSAFLAHYDFDEDIETRRKQPVVFHDLIETDDD